MAPFPRRVEIMLDDDRYRRLEQHAEERGASVAAVIREAIDRALPAQELGRRQAADALLEAEQMPVDDWPVLEDEMLTDRYGGIGP